MQLLDAVRANKKDFSSVLFVTDDRKPDWWAMSGSKITGPRVELRQEIANAGSASFHMYTFSQFLEHVRTNEKKGSQSLSAATLAEVRKVDQLSERWESARSLVREIGAEAFNSPSFEVNINEMAALQRKTALICVRRTLRLRHPRSSVVDAEKFVDFVVQEATGLLGGLPSVGYLVRAIDDLDDVFSVGLEAMTLATEWRTNQERSFALRPKVRVIFVLFGAALDLALGEAWDDLSHPHLAAVQEDFLDLDIELQVGTINGGVFEPLQISTQPD